MKLKIRFKLHCDFGCKESEETSRDRTLQEGVGTGGKALRLTRHCFSIIKYIILLHNFPEHIGTVATVITNMI